MLSPGYQMLQGSQLCQLPEVLSSLGWGRACLPACLLLSAISFPSARLQVGKTGVNPQSHGGFVRAVVLFQPELLCQLL